MSEIIEYSQTEQALSILREKYLNVVFDVRTTAGMKAAKEARADVKGYRTSLEKKRVEIKAPALERCKLIDSEAKRIEKELSLIEDPIDKLIKAEEERKEQEKLESLRRENLRITEIENRIEKIRNLPVKMTGASSDDLYLFLESFNADQIDDSFAEFKERAKAAFIITKDTLNSMFNAALRAEAEAEKVKAELAELEKLRLEKAERDRVEKELEYKRQAELAALQKAAQDKIEEEQRASRLKIEEEEKVAREAREEAYRIEQKAKDEEEKKRRSIERHKNNILDGRDMLKAFVYRFGNVEEFESIAEEISSFITETEAA